VPPAQLMSLFISQDRTWCQAEAEFGIVLGRLVLGQRCSRPPIVTGSARTASSCSGGLDGNADEPSQTINLRFYANVHVFTQDLNVYAGFGRLRNVYAVITQCLRIDYALITH